MRASNSWQKSKVDFGGEGMQRPDSDFDSAGTDETGVKKERDICLCTSLPGPLIILSFLCCWTVHTY